MIIMKPFILINYNFKSKVGKFIDFLFKMIINDIFIDFVRNCQTQIMVFQCKLLEPKVLLYVIEGATKKKVLFGIIYHGALYNIKQKIWFFNQKFVFFP